MIDDFKRTADLESDYFSEERMRNQIEILDDSVSSRGNQPRDFLVRRESYYNRFDNEIQEPSNSPSNVKVDYLRDITNTIERKCHQAYFGINAIQSREKLLQNENPIIHYQTNEYQKMGSAYRDHSKVLKSPIKAKQNLFQQRFHEGSKMYYDNDFLIYQSRPRCYGPLGFSVYPCKIQSSGTQRSVCDILSCVNNKQSVCSVLSVVLLTLWFLWIMINVVYLPEIQRTYWRFRTSSTGDLPLNVGLSSRQSFYSRQDVSIANPFIVLDLSPVIKQTITPPQDWEEKARSGGITSTIPPTDASTFQNQEINSPEKISTVTANSFQPIDLANNLEEPAPRTFDKYNADIQQVLVDDPSIDQLSDNFDDNSLKNDIKQNLNTDASSDILHEENLESLEIEKQSTPDIVPEAKILEEDLASIKLNETINNLVEKIESKNLNTSITEEDVADKRNASLSTESKNATLSEETNMQAENVDSKETADIIPDTNIISKSTKKSKESENDTDKQSEIIKDPEETTETEEDIVEDASSDAKDTELEHPPLETYSQFASRVHAEKQNDAATNGFHISNGNTVKGPKIKSKNYASMDCGSKVVSANSDSQHSNKVITSSKDEYMLNKCKEKLWFIVELCESIQPQKFDLANFELYSNSPHDIIISGSHRYPSREWSVLGKYTGQEGNRTVQSFPLHTEDFFKYIKVEVPTFHGSEFFCPISLFRIYGLSEYEVIEDGPDDAEDPEIEMSLEEEEKPKEKEKDGVLGNVYSMFSGVFDVIKRGSWPSSKSGGKNDLSSLTHDCRSLPFRITINQSTCPMASSLNYILSCYQSEYLSLLQIPVVASTVKNTSFCQQMAKSMCTIPDINDSQLYDTVCNNSYVCVMLSPKHVLAMCLLEDVSILSSSPEPCAAKESQQHENFSTVEDTDIVTNKKDELKPKVISGTPTVNPPKHIKTKANDKPTNGKITQTVTVTDKPKDSSTKTVATDKPENSPKSDRIKNDQNKASNKTTTIKVSEEIKLNNLETQDEDNDLSEPTIEAPYATQMPGHPEVKSNSHTNKESVIVRLSNKIRTLENNMSISSQYLESLSTRYKEQIAAMEMEIKAAITTLNETAKKAHESDIQHEKDLNQLSDQMSNVTNLLMILLEDKENLSKTVVEQHLFLMFIEVILLSAVFMFCNRRYNVNHIDQGNTSGSTDRCNHQSRGRRRSVDSVKSSRQNKERKRRPSEEALNISGTYKDLLIVEPIMPIIETDKKKKKKKSNTLKRSKSNVSVDLPYTVEHSTPENQRKLKRQQNLESSPAGVLFYDHYNRYSSINGDEESISDLAQAYGRKYIQDIEQRSYKSKRLSLPILKNKVSDHPKVVQSLSFEGPKHNEIHNRIISNVNKSPREYLTNDHNYFDTKYDPNLVLLGGHYNSPYQNGHHISNYQIEDIPLHQSYHSIHTNNSQEVLFKGKTKLRSDNWLWYTTQPKTNGASSSDTVSSSSESSHRAVITTEQPTRSGHKKKRKHKGKPNVLVEENINDIGIDPSQGEK